MRNNFLRTTSLTGLLATSALNLLAQSVVLPPTAVSNIPPAVVAQNPVSESVAPSSWANSPFQYGPINLRPHLFYRFLSGDGLQSSPGNQKTSSINSISFGVLANIGSHWTFDYTPTKTYYSDDSFKDTLDHSVRLLGETGYENWSFNLSQTFTSTFAPLIETGRQTGEDNYGTEASVGYRFTDRVQLETLFNHQARFTTVFSDSRDTSVGQRLHYKINPRIDTSVSLDYGHVNMSVGNDMNYTRPGAQLRWRATDKTTVNLQAGYENRSFKSGGVDDLNSPTFGAGIQFQPFTTTTLSFNANKGVTASYFTNQVTKGTSWNLNLEQRLLQRYYLSAGYSGQKSEYVSTDTSVITNRDDESSTFNLRLSTLFFQRATVAVLYQNTHNTSNNAGFGFTSSQVGVEIGYRF